MGPMVFGWWKRRQAAREAQAEAAAPDDRRERYRRGAGSSPMQVFVSREGETEFTGEFIDVSAGGAAARFTLANDPGMKAGEIVSLTIKSSTRDNFVRTPARVVYSEPGGDQHWRYGFQFVSTGDLYSQLDEFYSRFFNRRGSPRVKAPAERRVTIALLWGDNEQPGTAHDVSGTGMCVAIPLDAVARLQGIERVRLRFRLPGSETVHYGPARILHRNRVVGRMLLGIEFDLEREDGLTRTWAELEAFVQERHREVERWERAVRGSAA